MEGGGRPSPESRFTRHRSSFTVTISSCIKRLTSTTFSLTGLLTHSTVFGFIEPTFRRKMAPPTGSNNTTTTMYYRVGGTNSTTPVVEEIHADDATRQIAGMEAFVPSQDIISEANLHVSAARRIFDKDAVAAEAEAAAAAAPIQTTSWRVSNDEFVIKIDASPLHMSAAQRMFDQQKRQILQQQQQQQQEAIQEEEEEEEEESGDNAITDESSSNKKHENEFKKFWGKMMKIYKIGGGDGAGK